MGREIEAVGGVMVTAADGILHKFVLCLHRNKRTRPRGCVYPGHCHINRMHARKSVSASYQAAAVAVFQTSNASVRNPLNMDLLSK